MTNFNTNFQFNIAQLNSISNEQEKQNKVSKIQQEKIAQQVEIQQVNSHNSVSATKKRDNADKIKDEKHQQNKDSLEEDKEHTIKNKAHNELLVVLFKDDKRGKIIDLTC